MSASRVRLAPEFKPRGLYALMYLLGTAWLIAFVNLMEYVVQPWLNRVLTRTVGPPWQEALVVLAICLCVPVSVAIVLTHVANGYTRLALAGGVFAAGMVQSVLLQSALRDLAAGASFKDWASWELPLAAVTFISVGAGLFAGIFLLVRTFGFQLVHQTEPPSLCLDCAYDRSANPELPCPECGLRTPPMTVRVGIVSRTLVFAVRWARRAMALAIIAATVLAAWYVVTRVVPARRFAARFESKGQVCYGFIDHGLTPSPATTNLGQEAQGRLIDVGDPGGRMILVCYCPHPSRGFVPMQVRVVKPLAGSLTGYTDWGTPSVLMELNKRQADRVIASGLPDGVVPALLDTADEVFWKPTSRPGAPMTDRVTLDPDRFFEQATR